MLPSSRLSSTWKTFVSFIVCCSLTTFSASVVSARTENVPLLSSANSVPIPDHYIVVLKDHVDDSTFNVHLNWLNTVVLSSNSIGEQPDNRIKHQYNFDNIKGYAGKFHADVVESLRNDDNIAYIEKDSIVTINAPYHINPLSQLNPDFSVDKKKKQKKTVTQVDAPWGLSRISHRSIPTADHYQEYTYPKSAGGNVTVYIVDTGISIHHTDFEGRASWGVTIPENDEDVDGNGHGTHVAGTIGGKLYGVTKKTHLVAIKVLSSNGSGTMSDVIKGVEWTVLDHRRRQKLGGFVRSVANMSLGGGSSRTLDNAVNAAVRSGVHFAVAAGNDNSDACKSSPAAASEAVTVGATAIDDRMAWFSNHGKCVDVFAPGKDILSCWIGSKTAVNTISGTSMASPHVAGLLASLLSENIEKDYSGKELKELAISLSTKDAIKGLPKKGGSRRPPNWPFPWPPPGGDDGDDDDDKTPDTPNRLIFNGVPTHSKGDHDVDEDIVSDYTSEKTLSSLSVSPSVANDDGVNDNEAEEIKIEYERIEYFSAEEFEQMDDDSAMDEDEDFEITPGFESFMEQFLKETLDKANGIAGWMKSKVSTVDLRILVL